MGGWYILGAVLALLALLLALPAGVRVRWDGQPLVLLRLGPLRFQLLPPKKEKKPEKPAKDTASPEKKAKKEKKPRPRFNREQLLYSIDRGLHLIGKLLVRFRRGLRLDPVVLRLTVAGPDPADAAALYGRLCAALSALLPGLRQLVSIRNEDIRLSLDFDRTELELFADIGVSMRVFHLLGMGFAALGALVTWAIGYRRRASNEPEKPAPEQASPKQEAPASQA